MPLIENGNTLIEPKIPEKLLYTVADAAFLLSLASKTIYGYVSNGSLKPVKIGKGVIRFEMTELQRFVKSNREKPRRPHQRRATKKAGA